MKTVESMLSNEKYKLGKIIQEVEKRIETAPQGKLRIAKKKDHVEYYYCEGNVSEKGEWRYLKKNELDLAKRIAQRDYDTRVLKCVKKRIRGIDSFIENYKALSLDGLYQSTNSCRRELIDATILSDGEFVKQWQAIPYEGKMFGDKEHVIITERGERVRSKSEKIIADKLYMLGIPYRYECPLILDDNIKIYPDFTILRMPMREEVYLEHFGMMDDADYVNAAISRINLYEENGIYLGSSLYFTHETSRKPLNTKIMDKMIREWFCEE